MRALIFPALVGLLLFAGCKKAKPPEAADVKSPEPNVVELQQQLEEALKR